MSICCVARHCPFAHFSKVAFLFFMYLLYHISYRLSRGFFNFLYFFIFFKWQFCTKFGIHKIRSLCNFPIDKNRKWWYNGNFARARFMRGPSIIAQSFNFVNRQNAQKMRLLCNPIFFVEFAQNIHGSFIDFVTLYAMGLEIVHRPSGCRILIGKSEIIKF